jgi:hypothetical protein
VGAVARAEHDLLAARVERLVVELDRLPVGLDGGDERHAVSGRAAAVPRAR